MWHMGATSQLLPPSSDSPPMIIKPTVNAHTGPSQDALQFNHFPHDARFETFDLSRRIQQDRWISNIGKFSLNFHSFWTFESALESWRIELLSPSLPCHPPPNHPTRACIPPATSLGHPTTLHHPTHPLSPRIWFKLMRGGIWPTCYLSYPLIFILSTM